MIPSHVHVEIDLSRIRRNAQQIVQRVGVDVLAVVKADAYGLGAARVAQAIGDVVQGFCVFSLAEAQAASLAEVGRRPILALGPSMGIELEEFLRHRVRPAVWTAQEARRLQAARPVLCVDTGMQRFACPAEQAPAVLAAAKFDEAFTHAIRVEQAQLLSALAGGRGLRLHAAASGLMDDPAARLNAVRPGMALYRGAARISAPLVEVHEGGRPAGYGGFRAARFGVILCGYSGRLRIGSCMVNGQRRSVLEVGMQSAFVEIGSGDKVGDEVVLLGDSLTEAEVAAAWGVTEQQALLSLAAAGQRIYRDR